MDSENRIAQEIVNQTSKKEKLSENDHQYKLKAKINADRNCIERHFIVGDYVLAKQTKQHKLSTNYEPTFYVITQVQGSSIRARRINDNREIFRDASHFKLANTILADKDIIQPERQEKTLLTPIEPPKRLEKPLGTPEKPLMIHEIPLSTSEKTNKGKTPEVEISSNKEEEKETSHQVDIQPRRSGRERKKVIKMNL